MISRAMQIMMPRRSAQPMCMPPCATLATNMENMEVIMPTDGRCLHHTAAMQDAHGVAWISIQEGYNRKEGDDAVLKPRDRW